MTDSREGRRQVLDTVAIVVRPVEVESTRTSVRDKIPVAGRYPVHIVVVHPHVIVIVTVVVAVVAVGRGDVVARRHRVGKP